MPHPAPQEEEPTRYSAGFIQAAHWPKICPEITSTVPLVLAAAFDKERAARAAAENESVVDKHVANNVRSLLAAAKEREARLVEALEKTVKRMRSFQTIGYFTAPDWADFIDSLAAILSPTVQQGGQKP